jgi:hypothetical protein
MSAELLRNDIDNLTKSSRLLQMESVMLNHYGISREGKEHLEAAVEAVRELIGKHRTQLEEYTT